VLLLLNVPLLLSVLPLLVLPRQLPLVFYYVLPVLVKMSMVGNFVVVVDMIFQEDMIVDF
jgi:hypothetical protein